MAQKIAIGMVLDEIPSVLLPEFSKVFEEQVYFRNQYLDGENQKKQSTLSGSKRAFPDQVEEKPEPVR